ncbi:MAG TPA: ABC transporter ATP-binding protein [Dongiaceae bacterium]
MRRFNLLSMALSRSPLGPILGRYAWSVPVVAMLGFLASALEGLGIGMLIPLLNGLLQGGDASADSGVLSLVTRFAHLFDPGIRLIAVAICILVLVALKGVVQTINWTFIAWIDGRAGHDIRRALAQRLLELGYPFYLDHDPARLVTIVSIEAWKASDAIRLIFSIAAASAATAVFALMLAFVNWKLSMLVALGVVIIRCLQAIYARHLRALSERVSRANRGLAERMLQIIDAMRLIRIFGQEPREQTHFAHASEDVRQALYAVERASSRMQPMLEVMHSALFIVVLLVASASGMGVPIIIGFLVLLYRMQPHLLTLNQARLTLASLRGSVKEVEWLLDPEGKPLPPAGTRKMARLSGPICFEHVSFTYPNRPEAGPALTDVSFELHPNRSIALIGRSGAGKSTIVNMLCQLLQPVAGRITVTGIDLAEIDPANWRQRIGMAGQDIDLIEGTVAENIAYGMPNAAEADIVQAAQQADADGFIRALPQGYDTRVGNRGLSLSGGQRQRIGLARALVRKPEILILDEATNAVDGISERAIMALLRGRSRDAMTLVISHRQSTLECCQDGIVLEDGRVSESGPLRELRFYHGMSLAAER